MHRINLEEGKMSLTRIGGKCHFKPFQQDFIACQAKETKSQAQKVSEESHVDTEAECL